MQFTTYVPSEKSWLGLVRLNCARSESPLTSVNDGNIDNVKKNSAWQSTSLLDRRNTLCLRFWAWVRINFDQIVVPQELLYPPAAFVCPSLSPIYSVSLQCLTHIFCFKLSQEKSQLSPVYLIPVCFWYYLTFRNLDLPMLAKANTFMRMRNCTEAFKKKNIKKGRTRQHHMINFYYVSSNNKVMSISY